MKSRKILLIIGVLLIISSAIWLGSIKVRENRMRQEALELEREFQKEALEDNIEEVDKSTKDTTEERGSDKPIDRDEITNDKAIAVIRIDKIGVLAQVFDNDKQSTLRKGVGVIETTDMPSSELGTCSAIAGHRGGVNEDLSFLHIDQLENGDEVKVTTKDEVLVYKVTGSEVIEPDDWSKFTRDEDKSRLILMACHPYPKNDKRILIYTELEKSEK